MEPSECWPERLPNLSVSPLSIQNHDGEHVISEWLGDESVSHVVQMLRDGFRAAQHFGDSLFVLDRYFLTVPLLKEWKVYSGKAPACSILLRVRRRTVRPMKDQGHIKAAAAVLSLDRLSI